jgi:hypothetical protein
LGFLNEIKKSKKKNREEGDVEEGHEYFFSSSRFSCPFLSQLLRGAFFPRSRIAGRIHVYVYFFFLFLPFISLCGVVVMMGEEQGLR